ncbi:hypothetical protein Glove_275g50 [Diversispora epigaea]|uniref:Uncharacterized protein n=1 Tax=Diversispora epigaea TaxID=1348612 RepID=A0A397I346_9GLOM|nr:hypothetical protein Glove_275g50 [Diversispora epigaea]
MIYTFWTAEEGNADRQNKHGYCYLLGIGTPINDEKAFQWMKGKCYQRGGNKVE